MVVCVVTQFFLPTPLWLSFDPRMNSRLALPTLALAALLSACATTPDGPSVPVMPPPGKSFAQFSQESGFCKSQATNAVHGQAENANHRAIVGALIPTAIGAGLGAAIGSAYGDPWHGSYAGTGAGIGAGSGVAVGGAMGMASSSRAQGGIQQQYDNVYAACMLTYGNLIPGMTQRPSYTPSGAAPPMGPPPGSAQPYGGYGYGGGPGGY
ncbi:hypothetical protein AA23498_0683 [Acetobacter nitrogenifigens DSM 23921 = NBRC 105050]|uniref:Glycine-zipper-containing OmpA-like membrane domain-containing protein n=1 Tax=Acetobacter nitrogenifigens DSM 23921 = NBRC 105050 TaxID=1120919 RepID=A0A511X8E0_9PROT|nr:hypothetical protein AA23498_0683 [Acetobacter nitrogenifigens DSM 23921 = NBRC 105050]GEN59207.1 hypothetical protein ANI02nite_10910 [Acetobacter nitrogenifigens DSM 23921 = NBRC 105050]